MSKPAAQAAPVPRGAVPGGPTAAAVPLRNRPWVYRVASVVAGLLAWELAGPHVDPIFFTYPSAIARAFWEMTASGELPKYAWESLQILFYGMLIAIAVGIPLGVVMARLRRIDWLLDTYLNALYSTPTVALVPLLVLWFGIRAEAKIVVVFLFAVFPVLINTYQ